jgi:hypothetical protein
MSFAGGVAASQDDLISQGGMGCGIGCCGKGDKFEVFPCPNTT